MQDGVGMSDNAVSLDKPPDDHKDLWKAVHEISGAQQQSAREMSEMRKAITDMAVSQAVLSTTVDTMERNLSSKLHEQFLQHEKREMEMHNTVMVRGLLLLLSAMGALSYFILSKISFGD
jgi:hypothetical protein